MAISCLRSRRVLVWLALLCAAMPALASAQKPGPAADPMKPERDKDQQLVREVKSLQSGYVTPAVTAGTFGTQEARQKVTEAYNIHFTRFVAPINRNELTAIRDSISKDLNRAADAPALEVHRDLTALVRQKMEALALDAAQHEVVRYNALLALGELQTVSDQRRATPIAAVLTVLLGVYDDAKSPESLRAAAFVGMYHHAIGGIADGAQVKEIQNRMLALLANKQFFKKGSPAAQEFVRRRAADVLGRLKQPGAARGDDVIEAFLAILADKTASLDLRVDVAKAAGSLTYTTEHEKHFIPILQALANLAIDVTQVESPQYLQVRGALACVEIGLKGPDGDAAASVAKVVTGDKQTHVNGFLEELAKQVKTIDTAGKPSASAKDPPPDPLKLPPAVKQANEQLRAWLTTNQAQFPKT
ncbi:MAG: hypothetical protein HYS13_22635 [Planctomycetia bacterium]|nr:hypothetical protein [Planctomycetia bacterium]